MEAEPFYDEYAPKEWERLEGHRTEFAVSLRAINEFLPQPPCSILDVGGEGPGNTRGNACSQTKRKAVRCVHHAVCTVST